MTLIFREEKFFFADALVMAGLAAVVGMVEVGGVPSVCEVGVCNILLHCGTSKTTTTCQMQFYKLKGWSSKDRKR